MVTSRHVGDAGRPVTSPVHIRPSSTSADRSDRLFAAALAIVSAHTVDEMLSETTVRAAEIIGAHQALTSLTVDRDWTQAITTTHLSDKFAGARIDLAVAGGSGILAEVCRTNRPLRLTQAELERRTDWRLGDVGSGSGAMPPMRGFLAVPLVGREGRNLGLIQLSDRAEGEFEQADEEVLTSLAQFTAMAFEQLRLHADLAYESRLTRTVAENATSGLFLMDGRGIVTYMNSAGSRIIGYGLADLADRPLHAVVHHTKPDGTPIAMHECRIWRRVLDVDSVRSPFEDTFIRPDGSFYPVRVAAAPVMREERVVSVVLEVQDISAERAAAGRVRDLALSASDRAAKLRGLIEAIGDAVVVCEPSGAVSLMNPAAVGMFGPRLRHVSEIVARLRSEDGRGVTLDGEVAGAFELDGSDQETWVEARAFAVPAGQAPSRPDTGSQAPPDNGRIYVLRDVTAERQAKLLRETFIGMLSHELRTPITTLYGGAKILSRRTDDLVPETRSIVADIEAESERLYRLVEDLVVLTKSEAASLEVGREPVLLQRMLPRLVAAEARRWQALEFRVEVPADLPTVLAEPTYIEQIVRNLLTNAAKYGGSAGPIDVIATLEGDDAVVRVLDRGPGFPEGDAGRLFDIYYRSPQVARRAAGAGIGLFVCKSLIDAMDGRIWARERDGGGAEFGIALAALYDPDDGPA
jgi:PAS domain S-box-containing protein